MGIKTNYNNNLAIPRLSPSEVCLLPLFSANLDAISCTNLCDLLMDMSWSSWLLVQPFGFFLPSMTQFGTSRNPFRKAFGQNLIIFLWVTALCGLIPVLWGLVVSPNPCQREEFREHSSLISLHTQNTGSNIYNQCLYSTLQFLNLIESPCIISSLSHCCKGLSKTQI